MGVVLAYDRLGYFPIWGYFPNDNFIIIMENAVNTNGRREKFPSESQYFFKPEKEERRSFLILIN